MTHSRWLATVLASTLTFTGIAWAASPDSAALELGKQVFVELAQPQCGICHTLADAGTTGAVGPNLDKMELTEGKVRLAVSDGIGVMPAYDETLSQEQIDAVALYVSTVTGQTD